MCKRADGLERNCFGLELVTCDADNGDVFPLGLSGAEGRGNRGPRLHDVEAGLWVECWLDLTIVLMTPNNEVHPVRQDVFG